MMPTAPSLHLRPTVVDDLDTLFLFQADPESGYQAAFMPENPGDKAAYIEKYTRLLSNPEITMRTIIVNNRIAGSIAKFIMQGDTELTYWIDTPHRGKGIASAALQQFLQLVTYRPIYGRTAFDNTSSQRVLEKNGFIKTGTDTGYASARKKEIEEYIYKLD